MALQCMDEQSGVEAAVKVMMPQEPFLSDPRLRSRRETISETARLRLPRYHFHMSFKLANWPETGNSYSDHLFEISLCLSWIHRKKKKKVLLN